MGKREERAGKGKDKGNKQSLAAKIVRFEALFKVYKKLEYFCAFIQKLLGNAYFYTLCDNMS